ncbi:hypothetical protein MMC30_002045 [Trapelia coarctata]|nr:hypothetical protein [Trapelia coarctata]
MNSTIQTQLNRIEAALTTLTDSIASYNPSITAVHDLLAADDALTEGLSQLSHHQVNHAHILSLYSTSETLTTTLTSTLATLSTLRASILAAPATTQTASQRPIPSSVLLDYAKNISGYTAPPGLREKLLATKATLPSEPSTQQPSAQPESAQVSFQQPSTQQSTQLSDGPLPNGVPTPFHPPAPHPSLPPADKPTLPTTTNPGISSLTGPEIQWLDPTLHAPFLAWPSEDRIRRGGLAALQARIENGEDIEGDVDGGNDVEGEGGEDAMEGFTREVKDERDRNGVREGRVLENGVGPGWKKEKKPSVFSGLDMYDLEDECGSGGRA